MIGVKKVLAENVSEWGVINDACLLLAGMANRMQFIDNMYIRLEDHATEKIQDGVLNQLKYDQEMIAEFAAKLISCLEHLGDVMNVRDIIFESDDPLINQFKHVKSYLEILTKESADAP